MPGRRRIYIVAVVVILATGLIAYKASRPWMMEYRTHRLLSQLADQGDPGYQRLFAESFYDKGDFKSALKWELKSAEAGDRYAQTFMGHYFSYGINEQMKPAAPDYGKAREWYEKAAAQDFQESHMELCEIYSRGLGTAPDHEMAYFWCSLSKTTERSTKFRQFSGDTLDLESRQRADRRVAAWLDLHRKNP